MLYFTLRGAAPLSLDFTVFYRRLAAMPLGGISKFYRSLIMFGRITPYTPAQSLSIGRLSFIA